MATLRSVEILGVGNQAEAGSAPEDLARLAELSAGLATKAALVHTHAAGDVTGLQAAVVAWANTAIGAGYGVSVTVNGSVLTLGLVVKANGGILVDGNGLALDPGAVSLPGHSHVPGDVIGLADAVADWLVGNIGNGATVEWTLSGTPPGQSCSFTMEEVLLSGTYLMGTYEWDDSPVALGQAEAVAWASRGQPVVLGLEVGGVLTADRLTIPVGTANTNVSAVATLNRVVPAGQSVRWRVVSAPGAEASAWHCSVGLGVSFPTVSGTRLVASVIAAPSGGMLTTQAGLAVDFGTGSTQVAAGDHGHDQLHDLATGVTTSTAVVSVTQGQQVSVDVILDPAGGLVVNAEGLGVSAAWVNALIAANGGSGATLTVQGDASLLLDMAAGGLDAGQLTGSVRLDPSPGSNRGKLGVGVNGLYVTLGTDGDEAAAGGHTHSAATAARDGFLSAALFGSIQGLLSGTRVLGTSPAAAIADAEAVGSVSGTNGGYGFVSGSQFNAFVGEVSGAIATLNSVLEALRELGLVAD